MLRVGVLPDRSPDLLRERHEPLIRHLAASTGVPIELAIPASYDELLDWFDQGRVQLAWFGGLTFVRAERRSQARALAMRTVDLEFTTDFLVSSTRPERSLGELRGATIAFGPELSTSGHLMPRFHLTRLGVDPPSFFAEIRHSSGHDQTAEWVRDGVIDVGAVNSIVVESMIADGRLSSERVRVIAVTQPYRNYVWALRRDVPERVRVALLDAFLELEAGDPRHAEILALQNARGFVPARREEYEDLRSAAELAGLLGDGPS